MAGKRIRPPKQPKLKATLEEAAHDPKARAVAASAVAVGGAVATGKLVAERLAERRRRERARRYRLGGHESPIDGIGRIARGQLDLAIEMLDSKDGAAHGERVHEARKALKRLRAALRLSRDLLGAERYRRENIILRDAGQQLSEARDARVMLDTLDELATRHAAELPDPAWPRLRAALADAARDHGPNGSGPPAAVLEPLSEMRVRAPAWPLPGQGGPEAFAKGLRRIYGRGRHALRVAAKDPSAENLHELRKRAKDLWHGAQLLRPAAPKRMRKLARGAHRLSDLLGDDHDLWVLNEYVRAHPELVDPGERELLGALIERRQEALRRKALKRAGKLYRRKPRKLTRALATA